MVLEVRIEAGRSEAYLREADDFTRLNLAVPMKASAEEVGAAIAGVGTLASAEHALLRRDAIERLAGARSDDPSWQRKFGEMIDYAKSRGWADESGRVVRAHLERGEAGHGEIGSTTAAD